MLRAMTASQTVATAGAGAPAGAALWRAEFAETLKLAAPLAVTQLGQIAMMTTDLALLGRLGDEVVAAAALGHTVLFVAFTLGMGLVSAVAPLASQAFGARKPRFVRRAVRVGLWAAFMAGVPAHGAAVLGRGHSAGAGPGARDRRTGRALPARSGLVPDPGLDFHGAAQLHERGQQARAGAVDHARGHPPQRHLWPTR